jgi:hypothetical protein
MHSESSVTLHAFIRPGTPHGAAAPVVSQIAELYEFGLIGPGSEVWCNLEIPNKMWILSDRSTFLTIVDVPTAGWVRLTRESAAWGRTHRATTEVPRKLFSAAELPIALQDRDLVTVGVRNSDRTPMRVIHTGSPHAMDDFQATHGQMRVVDFKIGGFEQMAPLPPPTERDAAHAVLRGFDLLACTEPAVYDVIADNLAAFTTTVDVAEFDRIRVVQQRTAQIAEGIADPIADRVARLGVIPTGRGEAATAS